MERFRKFADETTGEHPFLPPKSQRSSADLLKALVWVPLRFAVLKLFVAVLLLSALLERLSPKLATPLQKAQQWLLFLAFSVKVSRVDSGSSERPRRTFTIANFSSPFDLFYLRSQFGGRRVGAAFVEESGRFELEEAETGSLGLLSLASSLTACLPRVVGKGTGDRIAADGDKWLLFETARTNNKVAFAPSPQLMLKVVRFCQAEKFDLRIVKLVHSNKAYCNASASPAAHWARCLVGGGDGLTVDSAVVRSEGLSILDSATVPLKGLFEKEPALKLMSKDFKFYADFLAYLRDN